MVKKNKILHSFLNNQFYSHVISLLRKKIFFFPIQALLISFQSLDLVMPFFNNLNEFQWMFYLHFSIFLSLQSLLIPSSITESYSALWISIKCSFEILLWKFSSLLSCNILFKLLLLELDRTQLQSQG